MSKDIAGLLKGSNAPLMTEDIPSMTLEDDYLRLLDSLASFYNSQITSHVGYQISISAVVAAFIFTLLESSVLGRVPSTFELSPLNQDTMIWTIAVVVIVVVSLVYVFSELPYCLKFLVGRTQYYIVLSHIVFEHMGLFVGDANRQYVEELKLRAPLTPGGIDRAIKNLLEGRLFVSRCVRQRLESHITETNLSAFDVTFRTAPMKNHYPNRVLRIFSQCDLIFLSYRGNLSTDERRGRLLMLQFEPEPCPRCGNPAEWNVKSKRYFCSADQLSFA